MCAPTPPTAYPTDPVETVATRLSVSEGAELARSLLRGVGSEAVESHGVFSASLGAVRAVSRRLGAEVPDVCDAAVELGIDPREALAAERKLESELSPPGDDDDVERLTARITAYAVLLDALENGVPAGDISESIADDAAFDAAAVREHLGRLRADRAMARLGFRLYDIARADGCAEYEDA